MIYLVKTGDFIRIEYTGYDDKGNIFDSTSGEIAKSIHGKEGPLLVIYGTDRLVSGMEDGLKNMQKGDSKELQLTSEKAFGSRSRSLVRIMSEKDFYRSEIRPEVGLAIHLDTDQGRMMGVVKSVSGGRILVDFNHPLADKSVKYSLKLTEVIEKTSDKINTLLDDMDLKATAKLGEKEEELTIEVMEKPKDPKDYEQKKQYLNAVLKVLFPNIKTVDFKEEDKKAEAKPENKPV